MCCLRYCTRDMFWCCGGIPVATMQVYAGVCVQKHVYVCICLCMRMYEQVYMHRHACIQYAHMYVCRSVNMYTCMRIYVYVYM